jgi:hypothetical protein
MIGDKHIEPTSLHVRIVIRDYVKEVDRFFGVFLYDESYKGLSKICTDSETRTFLKKLKAKEQSI